MNILEVHSTRCNDYSSEIQGLRGPNGLSGIDINIQLHNTKYFLAPMKLNITRDIPSNDNQDGFQSL